MSNNNKPLQIALIGYGKMGKAIEQVALSRGHQIILKIDHDNLDQFTKGNLSGVDVAIEFTGPESAFGNIKKCIEWGVPIVSGSTGWTDQLSTIKILCEKNNGAFLYASNFSIGVNLFFALNKQLARLMTNYPEYEITMEEIHHTQKKDAPSGTAITLAEGILENYPAKTGWSGGPTPQDHLIPITSKRIDPAAGTHSIKYACDVDQIEIIHTAHNRLGFAKGAVIAAEYIVDKKGYFSMSDVLNV